jgi:hypothetical protein
MRNIESVADDAPSAEAMLIRVEELRAEGLDEELETGPSPRRAEMRARLRECLEQIPEAERQSVIAAFAGGISPRALKVPVAHDTGKARGSTDGVMLSKSGAQWRIARAIARLKWITGPAALFTCAELEAELRGTFKRHEVRALSIYWRTTSQAEVFREMGLPRHEKAWQLLRDTIAKLPPGRYRDGFTQLAANSRRVVLGRSGVPLSPLVLFIRKRLRFERDLRTPATTLAARYESYAVERGAPWSSTRLFETLRTRGATECRMASPWATGSVRAWRGVGFRDAKEVASGV